MGDSFVIFYVSMENTTLNLPWEWQSHAICAFPEVKSLFTTEKLIGNDKWILIMLSAIQQTNQNVYDVDKNARMDLKTAKTLDWGRVFGT